MRPLACLTLLSSLALAAGGGPYLGQPLPGPKPVLFAPGLVNTGLATRDITFSPDGREIFFRVALSGFSAAAIVGTRLEGGRWTPPEVAPFARDARWRTLEPRISPDGQRFFFVSDRGEDGKPGPMGIWVMERQGAAWGEARRLPAAINGPDGSFCPSLTREGTLYFARDGKDGTGIICRARRTAEGFGPPEALPAVVQCGAARYNPFVAPDESFLILSAVGLPEARGLDYYILFRRGDDRWSQPLHLGPAVNAEGNGEISSGLSPDGKYYFFASGRVRPDRFPAGEGLSLARFQAVAREPGANGEEAIWWVDAAFLQDLKAKAVFP